MTDFAEQRVIVELLQPSLRRLEATAQSSSLAVLDGLDDVDDLFSLLIRDFGQWTDSVERAVSPEVSPKLCYSQ